MALRQEIPLILAEYEAIKGRLSGPNYELFDIFEGNLLPYILSEVKKQVSDKSFKSMEPRIVPINFLKKIIDKLSQIYNKSPKRTLRKPSAEDEKLFEYYKEILDIDVEMMLANEIFNLEKYCAIEPYIDNGVPALRVLQPDKFFAFSTSKKNPSKMTHYCKIMGQGKDFDVLHVYTDEEFIIINTKGDVLQEEMNAMGNANGINLIGKIPAILISRSKFDLIPREDTDILKMTKIMPILFSDINEVIFWQSFSVIYGIDVDAENLQMAPNAFWTFNTDPTKNTKPEIGTIKPQTDIEKVQDYIKFQLETWLNTRGIKTSASGSVDISASGISKMVDELDTSEDRKKQIPFFRKGESDLWNLIMNYLHPYWIESGQIDIQDKFVPGQSVKVDFGEQFGIDDPIKTLEEIKLELELGITTRKMALLKKNKGMTEKEAEDFLKQIDEESTIEVNDVDENEDQDTEAPEASREGSTST